MKISVKLGPRIEGLIKNLRKLGRDGLFSNSELVVMLRAVAERVKETVRKKTPGKKLPSLWKLDERISTKRYSISIVNLASASAPWRKILKWLEGGTSPHIIEPSRKMALRFPMGALAASASSSAGPAFIFAKKVRHPGTRAYRFHAAGEAELVRELTKIKTAIKSAIAKELARSSS